MIVDTHSHPYLEEFDADRAEVMLRARNGGVGHIVLPNVSAATIAPMRGLAAANPGYCSMAMGLHPTEVAEGWEDDLAVTERELRSRPDEYVAVGEVGIDLYWDAAYRREQMEALRRQSLLALELDLPLIIHCREGLDEVLEVMESLPEVPRGVFHSFGGTAADVERIRRTGDFHFGINGVVTFKNCKVRDALGAIGLDRLLLETDAPYLAPVPLRGKRNEPAFIVHTCAHIAATMGLTPQAVEEATARNAANLFGLAI